MSSLPKPVLRGHMARRGIKTIIAALCLGAFNGSLYHYFVAIPRKRAYEEFLKTYDPDAHMKDLIRWGYLLTPETMRQKVREAMNE